MSISANFIGAGKVGKTLARLLHEHRLITVRGVCNKSYLSACQAVEFIGAGFAVENIAQLPSVDLTFLTVSDVAIESVCDRLARQQLKSGSVVLHCSGLLSSDVLSAVRAQGCFALSIHPLKSFAAPALSVRDFGGTYCAIEGDAAGIAVVKPLFEALGAVIIPIEGQQKALYHAAAVFASNYVVTLAQQALNCFERAGINTDVSLKLMTHMMQSSLTNLQSLSPKSALTGPLRRGDVTTIQHHLQALENLPERVLYTAFGRATLNMIDTLDDTERQKMEAILS